MENNLFSATEFHKARKLQILSMYNGVEELFQKSEKNDIEKSENDEIQLENSNISDQNDIEKSETIEEENDIQKSFDVLSSPLK